MGSRLANLLVVLLAAAAAASVVVSVTLATRQEPVNREAFEGKPPVPPANLPTPAAGEIRAAFRAWPDGSIDTMQRLGRDRPKDPVVQLYRGFALIWAGYGNEATAALRAARTAGRDTIWEMKADNLLYPDYNVDYPVFELVRPNVLVAQGAELQRQGRRRSAARLFQQAARQTPNDEQALVAAAVGRFDKDNPAAAFSRLGPLSKRFPKGQIVRYNLGLLLAWLGQGDAAMKQFRTTVALGADSELGRKAAFFVERVAGAGTEPSEK